MSLLLLIISIHWDTASKTVRYICIKTYSYFHKISFMLFNYLMKIHIFSNWMQINFESDFAYLSKSYLSKDHSDLLFKMGYWDEDLEGNPYPFERHLSFCCCSGKLPLKVVFYVIGAFGSVKLMMSAISTGFSKCGKIY